MFAAAATITLALGLAACGDDDGGSGAGSTTTAKADAKPRTLALEVTGTAKKSMLTAPRSIPEGLTAITLTQKAKGEHSAQLIRFDEGHTAEEVAKAGDAWGDKPLPAWTHLEGGVSGDPERPATSVQVLPAGKYVTYDFGPEDAGGKPSMVEFEVTPGDTGATVPVPASAARIEMKEYAFAATGLKAGRHPVLIDNVGKEPHFVLGAPLRKGSTLADARKFFESLPPGRDRLAAGSRKSPPAPPLDAIAERAT